MNIIRILTIVLVLTILNSISVYALESQEIEVTTTGGGNNDDECNINSDCPTETNPQCLNSGNCGRCTSDTPCNRFDLICNTANGRCVECLINGFDSLNCDNKICENNQCVSCDGSNCPTGKICSNGYCVDNPVSGTECPCTNGKICNNGYCIDTPPIAPTVEGIPEEQPFPVFNFYNIIISILILFGYYIRKIYR